MLLCAYEAFAGHLTNLLEVRLVFSDFDGKGCGYSPITVRSSIMQIASYECLPFTKSQTPQQPVTLPMLVDCKVSEPTNLFWQGETC